jgi:hypothetical protein
VTCVGRDRHPADPVGRPCVVGKCRGPLRMAVEDGQRDVGQEPPEHGQVAPALDAGADQGGPRRPTVDRRCESADRDPRHRGGPERGDRPAVEDRRRDTGLHVVQDHDGVDRREPDGPVGREAGHPFHPEPVVGAGRVGSAQMGRHGVDERPIRTRMDADLGWQLGIGDERRQGAFGQAKALVEVGHRGKHVGRIEVAQRRWIG